MFKAFNKKEKPLPRIRVEDGVENGEEIHFAVSCRHCKTPYCVKGCITGALSIGEYTLCGLPYLYCHVPIRLSGGRSHENHAEM